MSLRRRIGWLAAGALALFYLSTSAVVLLNATGNATGALWLPSMPEAYYALERALYLPFRPWFSVLRQLQERPDVTYAAWTLFCRGPVVALALAVLGRTALAFRRSRREERAAAEPGS